MPIEIYRFMMQMQVTRIDIIQGLVDSALILRVSGEPACIPEDPFIAFQSFRYKVLCDLSQHSY